MPAVPDQERCYSRVNPDERGLSGCFSYRRHGNDEAREQTTMSPTVLIVGARILEGMFFTGLAGCAIVVVLSWISVSRSGFSSNDD